MRSRAAGANQRLGYDSDEMVRQYAAEVLGVDVADLATGKKK